MTLVIGLPGLLLFSGSLGQFTDIREKEAKAQRDFEEATENYEKAKEDYADEKKATEEKIKNLKDDLQLLNLKRSDISKAIADVEPILNGVYELDVLHAKYRNITAVSSILDYISTGRTESLVRTGTDPGAYNIYEDDVRAGKIITAVDLGFNRLSNKIDNLSDNFASEMSRMRSSFESSISKLAEQNQQSLHSATDKIVEIGKTISADNKEMHKDVKLIADYNEKTSQYYTDKYGIARSREGWPL